MASTGKTDKLGLSQYQPTDRPSFLTDVNADNKKIDDFAKTVMVKDSTVPTTKGLTAQQIDNLYVDANGFVRFKEN